mmetsp:Transcript_3320/g.8300  ORF Transcript_3320/g.8300 Transcript_3320/m.8300 type:complete len:217 (-) Transcript_3320:1908-2558(-)
MPLLLLAWPPLLLFEPQLPIPHSLLNWETAAPTAPRRGEGDWGPSSSSVPSGCPMSPFILPLPFASRRCGAKLFSQEAGADVSMSAQRTLLAVGGLLATRVRLPPTPLLSLAAKLRAPALEDPPTTGPNAKGRTPAWRACVMAATASAVKTTTAAVSSANTRIVSSEKAPVSSEPCFQFARLASSSSSALCEHHSPNLAPAPVGEVADGGGVPADA